MNKYLKTIVKGILILFPFLGEKIVMEDIKESLPYYWDTISGQYNNAEERDQRVRAGKNAFTVGSGVPRLVLGMATLADKIEAKWFTGMTLGLYSVWVIGNGMKKYWSKDIEQEQEVQNQRFREYAQASLEQVIHTQDNGL